MISSSRKFSRGFVLIEMIIYLALFSILLTGIFVSLFNILNNSYKLSDDVVLEEEMSFVMRKIDWLLNDINSITTPSSGVEGSSLTVKNGSTTITIDLDADGDIYACVASDCGKLTSENVKVDSLLFKHIPPAGNLPAGVNAKFTLSTKLASSTRTLSINKYLRPSL